MNPLLWGRYGINSVWKYTIRRFLGSTPVAITWFFFNLSIPVSLTKKYASFSWQKIYISRTVRRSCVCLYQGLRG